MKGKPLLIICGAALRRTGDLIIATGSAAARVHRAGAVGAKLQ